MDMYTLLYFKWITNKDLLCSTGNSAQCHVAAWKGGEFGGEWIHVYLWLSPFTVQLKLSQCCLLIRYTLIQKKGKTNKQTKTLGSNLYLCYLIIWDNSLYLDKF